MSITGMMKVTHNRIPPRPRRRRRIGHRPKINGKCVIGDFSNFQKRARAERRTTGAGFVKLDQRSVALAIVRHIHPRWQRARVANALLGTMRKTIKREKALAGVRGR